MWDCSIKCSGATPFLPAICFVYALKCDYIQHSLWHLRFQTIETIHKYHVCVYRCSMMIHAIVPIQAFAFRALCTMEERWIKSTKQRSGMHREKETAQVVSRKKLCKMQSDFTSLKYLLLRLRFNHFDCSPSSARDSRCSSSSKTLCQSIIDEWKMLVALSLPQAEIFGFHHTLSLMSCGS